MTYSGNDDGGHGVGIILSPKLTCIVLVVQQKNERIIGVDLKLDQDISLIQVYAPQAGRSMGEKDEFYAQLQASVNEEKYKDNAIICGDWNGHVGTDRKHREDIIVALV